MVTGNIRHDLCGRDFHGDLVLPVLRNRKRLIKWDLFLYSHGKSFDVTDGDQVHR